MQLEFSLGHPSFTLLHRAGLAGLWMTLKQLEQEGIQTENCPGELTWQTNDPRRVTMQWNGSDLEVLDWLLKQAFQVSPEGLIALRGLDSKTMPIQTQVTVHQGMMGTFLQHPSTRKSTGVISKSFSIEEDKPEIVVTYNALKSYVYQGFASILCDKKGYFLNKPVSVAGWLNPGAVVRHVAFSVETSFEELPENAFVLLFAPVACYYFLLRSKLRDKRAQYALVIPEVTNLEIYAKYRQQPQLRGVGYKDFFACSLGDAGLRFLAYETAADTAKTHKVERCQVLTLGTVAWSTQQKTRTDLHVVEADTQVLKNYQASRDFLSDRVVAGKNGGFVASSLARELISENLARKLPWYSGLSDRVNSNDLFKQLTYEREGLCNMVQKAQWNAESERLFVQACHEAIKFTYGQISSQAKKRGEIPNFDRETVRIRTGLSRCKNAQTFREFITDFWSRAGKIPTLQSHWLELMDLVTGRRDWKMARDLTLLALASYKGKGITDSDSELDDEEYMIDIDA
ncbi:type I-MYXAN CRISPR-associated Cas8a1/Cmx1 [Leptolyngbya sp. FACHB-261]|uniref:type I-MYXAN CRISPR-associated Cas8a1/Cmx1 n=1 Tax=Leptolyngbya sp. FACHB-261 TaxID=2692806 RepID=UPI001687C99B|nr:type I-MYXAN CRISPR-associated Cas8a1/Cmx1 [Leptolyngbya sp. FACHB-261]MBD2105332.1 type I-MYXAN CRISPR-associated Cas8a1/Cmx1 [Leptolyngbya sp. FACHB-261]